MLQMECTNTNGVAVEVEGEQTETDAWLVELEGEILLAAADEVDELAAEVDELLADVGQLELVLLAAAL
jgi:hypothetical protein